MTATSDTAKFWNMLYVDQGARIRNGLSIGIDSVSNPGTWVQFAAFDAEGNLTAPNIYNKTEVDNAVGVKIGGSGTSTYLPKNTDTRVMTNSVIQETPTPI